MHRHSVERSSNPDGIRAGVRTRKECRTRANAMAFLEELVEEGNHKYHTHQLRDEAEDCKRAEHARRTMLRQQAEGWSISKAGLRSKSMSCLG